MRDDPDLPGAKGTCLWFSDVLSSPGEFRQEYLFFWSMLREESNGIENISGLRSPDLPACFSLRLYILQREIFLGDSAKPRRVFLSTDRVGACKTTWKTWKIKYFRLQRRRWFIR